MNSLVINQEKNGSKSFLYILSLTFNVVQNKNITYIDTMIYIKYETMLAYIEVF